MHIATTSAEIKGTGAFWTRVVAPSASLAGLTLFTAIFFGFITTPGQAPDFTCTPNGVIKFSWSNPNSSWVASEPYSATWDTSQFLSITLGFGNFSYSQAKAIDFMWDLVVGRGGQLLLVYCCYPKFRRALLTKLESSSISLPVFAALAFDKIGWTSIGAMSSLDNYHYVPLAQRDPRKPATTNATTRCQFGRLSLFVVAFAYILIFPTWISIMTGYQAKSKPYVQIPNGNLVPTTALSQPDAVVVDGSRVGLSDDRVVFQSNESGLYNVLSACERPFIPLGRLVVADLVLDSNELWALPSFASVDTDDTFSDNSTEPPLWTFTVTSQQTTNDTLRPIACISICDTSVTDCPTYCSRLSSSTILVGNTTYTLSPQPLNVAVLVAGTNYAANFRSYGDEALTTDYLETHTTCEPTTRYRWGFSSLLLFTFCLVSMLFAAIILVLDAEAYWHGRANRLDVPANVYRDALDLSIELRAQHGDEVEQMPAKELLELVERERGRMSVDVEDLPQSRGKLRRQERARAPPPSMDREAMAGFLSQVRANRTAASKTVRLQPAKDDRAVVDDIELGKP